MVHPKDVKLESRRHCESDRSCLHPVEDTIKSPGQNLVVRFLF